MEKTKTTAHRGDKFAVRKTVRWLELIYDAIILAATLGVVYGILGAAYGVWEFNALSSAGLAIHLAGYYAFIFGARFLFRVYWHILRYGNPGSFARLFLADIVGGGLFFALNQSFHYLPKGFHSEIMPVLITIFANLLVCFLARLVYYYLYFIAGKETPFGNFCHALLRRFAMVDARSEKVAEVLSLREALRREKLAVSDPINDIQRVAMQFQLRGKIEEIHQMNKGYINRTYRVRTLSENNHTHFYTLQRINSNVFPDVDALMANYVLVTEHLHKSMLLPGHTERGSIQIIKPTKSGEPYYRDPTGCWRMLTHFTDVYGMDIPDNPQVFYFAGQSFGTFMKCMADVDASRINVVIPNFHNTYSRYLDLEKSVQKNAVGRLDEVKDELKFIRDHKDKYDIINKALETGEIPTRICHNDCNLNNILFSRETNLPVAIIDLDTVMPGSPLYDFGDSMRAGTNTARDDEKDLSLVSCNLELYESYARGYLEACGDVLTEAELELLPFASFIVTMEDGIRFLADHLDGDTYYNIYYPGQNLDRSRTQLALAADMERKLPRIREILQKIYDELGLKADAFRRKF